ncbi:putative membrane protein [Chitinophaga skermanii]|uniref:Putative membrane protein n=1 Tax=Chitinophaga skermanii TaxID=331697 RepID=A0A327QKL9_9BACT|nr:MauE/DoxX family redox-associated membrane protein [Chitinophaga skermanii]RAJ05079.1 putative membrane protein [Chitinophaga skermanii]
MAFFLGLIAFTFMAYLLGLFIPISLFANIPANMRVAITVMFVIIGIMHLKSPDKLRYMIDQFVPYPTAAIYVSGVLEILFGILIIFPTTRLFAAWGLILLLVLMFPANIYVAVKQLPAPGGLPSSPWYTWSRLAFQPLYIYWIYLAAIK